MSEILIVGAGPAGLAVAAVLRRRGVRAKLLERGEAVGANWRSRYDGLRLNTVRWLSGLPGDAIPRRAGRWVSRDDYVSYLEHYADLHHLDVETQVDVERIVPGRGSHSRRWRLHTSKGELAASAVVVASGPFDRPVIPPWPGLDRYDGAFAHAATYRDPALYRGQHVLVIGGGASGLEISLLLTEGGAARVDLSVRSCTNLFPRQLGPYPLTPLPATRHAPRWLLDAAGALTHRMLGSTWPDPLPRPAAGLGTALHRHGTEPVVADGIVPALRAGRVGLLPAVDRFTATAVHLVDGSVVRPDMVLAATGYRSRVEKLAADLDVFDQQGRLIRGDGGPCSGAPGLAFVGFQPAVTGRLPQMPSQARRAAHTVLAAAAR